MPVRLVTAAALLVAASAPAEVTIDAEEAETALGILEAQNAGRPVSGAQWARLFGAPGYRRLKAREAAMNRAFTDDDFKAFLTSPEARAMAPDFRRALGQWRQVRAEEPARRARAYLPEGARLKATVFYALKPKTNSFVWDLKTDPAIFLYLDPKISGPKAANTMAHELHHVGFAGACTAASAERADSGAAALRPWLGAFGEGLAMMAAAGGPTEHPHAVSDAAERAEWDRNAARFDQELAEQNAFFRKVLDGRAGDEAAVAEKMRGYFGVQGPWYTVGWRMAYVIETTLGRKRAIAAFCDSRTLLAVYNEAAAIQNRHRKPPLPLWDAELAARVAGR